MFIIVEFYIKMEIRLKVTIKRRSFPPLYLFKPSELFEKFEETLKENLKGLGDSRVTNRAIKEFFRRKGSRKLKKLKREFLKLDEAPLVKRKAIYNAFYRIFQRLEWALSSGSEKEIELKVWATSSIDYLTEVLEILGENDGRGFK
ncbi:MAG: hypothetical protein DSZ26_03900 [Thermovibrio sp.]|nr:MAG: hypothetical protein DSZ26_03900 [Thermovibrio sp.]